MIKNKNIESGTVRRLVFEKKAQLKKGAYNCDLMKPFDSWGRQ